MKTDQTAPVPWPSGRVSDSVVRGWGFDPHSGCVLEQDTFTSQKYWLYPGSGGSILK